MSKWIRVDMEVGSFLNAFTTEWIEISDEDACWDNVVEEIAAEAFNQWASYGYTIVENEGD